MAEGNSRENTTRIYNANMFSGFLRHPGRRLGALLVLVALSCTSVAQSSTPSDDVSKTQETTATPAAPVNASPPMHRFWDRTNILLFSGIGVFRGLDYASTRNFQRRGRTEILLPDDVVDNSAGFAALEAAATATSIGLSYVFHRTGHHKMERWLSIGHIGVTGFGVARNYSLKTRHP